MPARKHIGIGEGGAERVKRPDVKDLTIVGSGFVAKYPEGGGNFSVPLQYVLGLRRMGRPLLWLELLESSGDPARDRFCISAFRRRLASFDLQNDYCLILLPKGSKDVHDITGAKFYGKTRRQFLDLLAGPSCLLNLSFSIRPPFVDQFPYRKLCSLDPTEVCFWMQRMEMGQSYHQEFWSIGLNMNAPGSRVPKTDVTWKTYFPLVETSMFEIAPRPVRDRFSTIGQWYWDGMVEFDGEWRDFSKQAAFEKYLGLAARLPEVRFDLAMNLAHEDPERERLESLGWKYVVPHTIARTPQLYYQYLRRSTGEFSAVKLESFMGSGWLSDRSGVYLALGRPVITESTGAEAYLPETSGLFFVSSEEEALEAVQRVRRDWNALSKKSRACAVECFDAVKNLKKILGD